MNFLKKYKNKKNIRYDSFLFALNLAYERNHKTIVETGTARGKKKLFFFNKFNWTDGMSTLIFSEYAMRVDGKLHSWIFQVTISKMQNSLLQNFLIM